MLFKISLKELARPILSNRWFNPIVVFIGRLIRPVVSDALLVRMPVNGIVRCKLPNLNTVSFYSNADDPMVSKLCFKGLDGYEPESIHLFRRLASSAKCVLDIGANTGIYALVAAIENPSIHVYAFEPVPRIFDRLAKNRALNNATNLHLSQRVVANFSGNTTLYIPIGKMPTSSSMVKGHRQAQEIIEVPTTTLDAYIDAEAISKVDLIKIDTESTEPWVLEGGYQMLARDKPAIVCEVLQTKTGRAIQTILDELGYEYYWITADGLVKRAAITGDPEFKYLNYLFIQPGQIALLHLPFDERLH